MDLHDNDINNGNNRNDVNDVNEMNEMNGTRGWDAATRRAGDVIKRAAEGLPFKILPDLANPRGRTPDDVVDLDFELTVDALAANIFWVLDNDEMRTKLIRRGVRNLERFSWDLTATALAGLYVDLANGDAS